MCVCVCACMSVCALMVVQLFVAIGIRCIRRCRSWFCPISSWSAHGWLMVDSWQVWHACQIPQYPICRCVLKPTRYKIIKPRPYKHNANQILIVKSAEGFREDLFCSMAFRVLLVVWCPGKYVSRMDSARHQNSKTSFIANVAQVSRCTNHCLLPR